MCNFIKRLFGKEDISEKALEHSSKGDYTEANRLRGGGHGQEALDYMDAHGIEYHIIKTFPNGVRVGNVPKHKDRQKKVGSKQSWFPRDWDRAKIKKAGQKVAKGRKYKDGVHKYGRSNGVDVGIIRTNGKIATIFPSSN